MSGDKYSWWRDFGVCVAIGIELVSLVHFILETNSYNQTQFGGVSQCVVGRSDLYLKKK